MKKSRLALIQSIIALILCASMLVGTTFAWFTDSVSSGINTIAAGNLDVELYHSNAVARDEQVTAETTLFLDLQGDPIKWEPGVVSYENLRITNAGDLALAYQLAIATANENFVVETSGAQYGLSQILKVGVVEGGITATDREGVLASVDAANWTTLASFVRSGSLMAENAGESEATWGLVVYWEPGEFDNYWNLNNGKTLSWGETLQIDLGVSLIATQEAYESDAFGTDYDTTARVEVFPVFVPSGSTTTTVVPDAENKVAGDLVMTTGPISASIPAGVQLTAGTTSLTMSVSEMEATNANITVGMNEASRSLDVHIEGVASGNTVPMEIVIQKAAPKGLNLGNLKLYHVEAAVPAEMTRIDWTAAFTAHNQFKYDPATGDIVLYMATFSEVALVANTVNPWDGEFDYTWYDANKTELTIANADQLAGFGAIVGGMDDQTRDSFAGKTVKLLSDINLGDKESENNEKLIFYPIGYYNSNKNYEKVSGGSVTSDVNSFEGTFDGAGHTISNFYQNTWEMFGDYNDGYSGTPNYYKDAMGLFGYVKGGTVKNLTVSNFSSDGEFTPTGVIAAYADGDSNFENIAITNCNPRVYNTGNGGIIGIAGDTAKANDDHITLKNITVDNSNKISALWGSYDVGCGGLVGMYRGNVDGSGNATEDTISFNNCHVSAIMDVYNDVCGNYQYYAYRYAGMIIGSVRHNTKNAEGKTIPNMAGISATGCTVNYGDWNDYYYCEFVKNGHPSYSGPDDYKFSRVPHSELNFTDSNGNGVVDANERASVTGCKHNHTDAEDNKAIYLPFHQLFTGYSWGVSSIGLKEYSGIVTDPGITEGDQEESVTKFESALTADAQLVAGNDYTVAELFSAIEEVTINSSAVQVAVSALDSNGITATYVADTSDWAEGTLTFERIEGLCSVTIQDYNFCKPTTVILKDGKLHDVFAKKFTGDFLYRVGNQNEVSLGTLFAENGVEIQDSCVKVEISGVENKYTANTSEWEKGTIKFSGTGVAKIKIHDDTYCNVTELYLEVVDAVNATGATSATKNNVVLLSDCSFSSLEVSGGYTLYGNGFTMACGSDSYATDRTYAFVDLKGGILDNVKIVAPNFSHAIMYEKNKTENGNPSYTDSNGKTRYYNIRSAVIVTGTSKIVNSYISGGRAAIYVTTGTLTVENSTIYGGAVANIQAEASNNLVLENVTLIQKPIKANVNDTSKTVMGLSVVMMCDTTGVGAPVTLKGYLHQYAWANEEYSQYVPSDAQSVVSEVLNKSDFVHSITYEDGKTRASVNLGFAYMPNGTAATNANNMSDERSDKATIPYGETTVSSVASIYTYKSTNGTNDAVKNEPSYEANVQGNVLPTVTYQDTNDNRIFTTSYDAQKAQWKGTLKVDVDAGEYTFSFDNLLVQKYGKNLAYTVQTEDGTVIDKNVTIPLNSAVSNVYKLVITDDQVYDQSGNKTDKTATVEYIFELLATKTSLPAPTWKSKTLNGTPYIVVDSKGGDWNCAVPVLDGLKVKYWSKKQNKEIELDMANVVSAAGLSAGLQNGSNNTITITVADEYTLKITTTGFKTNDNGKPVVVNGKLYFTVSSSSNYVSTSTTDRTPSISYEFTDANNSDPLTLSTSFNVVYANHKATQYKYSSFCSGTLEEASCVTPDTLITLANGKQVRVDSLTGKEELLVWNLETGKLDSAPIMFVDSESEADYEIIHLYFSDGTDVKVIYEHGFWDYELNRYVYLDRYAQKYIGHTFAKQNGDKLSKVKLTDVVLETEVTTAWSPVTAGHLCYFVNGMLSMPGGVGGLFNIFEVDPATMAYDYESMAKDIETYGLFTYEEMNAIAPLSEDMFNAAGGAYLKISIGKGNLTIDELVAMINRYSKFI